MGFNTESKAKSKFINFKDGLLIHKVGGEKKSFPSFEGLLVDLDITDEVFDNKDYKKLTLFIQDNDIDSTIYQLGFPLNSGYGNAFCMICPNIDFSMPVEISGSSEKDKNNPLKKKTSMFVAQGGKTLKWFWTVKNPGKLPQPKEVKTGTGKNIKTVLDFSARNDFFIKMLIGKVRTSMLANGVDVTKAKVQANEAAAEDMVDPLDDLPF